MRCGYFDCFSGAAGDMILGAILHAGCPLDALQSAIARLKLPGVRLSAESVRRGGIAATQAHVNVLPLSDQARPHQPRRARHLPEILDIIAAAQLPGAVEQHAVRIFRRLAEAEAAVHGITVDSVHFHEVGADDAIVDIVGACAGIELLGIQRNICSPIRTGHGTVQCAHGILPVPAPATAELLKNVPLAAADEPVELTTPTAAAILTTLAESFGPPPAMRILSVGYGAGTRETHTRPNVLRLILGELETETELRGSASPADEQDQARSNLESDRVVVLEAQVDDATGQAVAFACETLLAAGALDAYVVPIVMKKSRAGQLLTVLGRPEDRTRLEAIIFRETTTFGIRRHECQRSTLPRQHATVATRFGPIRVKVGRRSDGSLQAWPEYEDCAAAARQFGAALRDVQQEALLSWSTSRAEAAASGPTTLSHEP